MTLSHGQTVAAVLAQLGHEPTLDAAAQLLFNIANNDQSEAAQIARQAEQILQLATQLRPLLVAPSTAGKNVRDAKAQVEQLRRMVLAMSTDLRGVLIALGSHLAHLRACVTNNTAPETGVLQEVLQVFAPLANRLGVWQLKWELEDLAFRYAQPERYQRIDTALNARREERQALIELVCHKLGDEFSQADILAQVYGRPKHIYSIANKMAAKNLPFEGLYDLRAVRVVVGSVRDCYTALGIVHDIYLPIAKEFDDYIARPKPNGYQSLHTVIVGDDGKPVEVQIRTQAMHAFAEFGVAAHWRYKEGNQGNQGNPSKASAEEAKVAWLRQLLAWKKDLSQAGNWQQASAQSDYERIFCLTPAGRVVELVEGATPIDFAYHLHTDLGHQCRGAKVDGQLVPLNTPLRNGQTIEVLPDRKQDAMPSRDWLNPALGYLASPRSRTKVRAWFNAVAQETAIVQGRIVVEKELARLGKTATSTPLGLAELAQRMGYLDASALFIAANKVDFHAKTLETAILEPSKEPLTAQAVEAAIDALAHTRIAAAAAKAQFNTGGLHLHSSDIWVVGVDRLLTQMARCCHPAPPDKVMGYITKGKGVSLHRANCASLHHLAQKNPERLVECAWNEAALARESFNLTAPVSGNKAQYAVEVRVIANDRAGILRDVSDAFSKHKLNITALQSQVVRGESHLLLTILIDTVARLNRALASVREVAGVVLAMRR